MCWRVGRAIGGRWLLVIAAVSWGTVGVVAVQLESRSGVTAEAMAFLRLAIASVALAPFASREGTRRRRTPSSRETRLFVFAVGAGLAGNQLFFFLAMARIGPASAALVALGLSPVFAGAMESILRRRLPGRSTALSLTLALSGLYLLTGGDLLGSALTGIALSAMSAFCLAALAITRHNTAISNAHSRQMTAATMVVGAVLLFPFAVGSLREIAVDAPTVAALGYIGVVATAAAYSLFFRGLNTVSPSAALTIAMLEPVTASILAAVLGQEAFTPRRCLGALVLLLAIGAKSP